MEPKVRKGKNKNNEAYDPKNDPGLVFLMDPSLPNRHELWHNLYESMTDLHYYCVTKQIENSRNKGYKLKEQTNKKE